MGAADCLLGGEKWARLVPARRAGKRGCPAERAHCARRAGLASIRTLKALHPIRLAAKKVNNEEFCARFDAAERALNGFHPT